MPHTGMLLALDAAVPQRMRAVGVLSDGGPRWRLLAPIQPAAGPLQPRMQLCTPQAQAQAQAVPPHHKLGQLQGRQPRWPGVPLRTPASPHTTGAVRIGGGNCRQLPGRVPQPRAVARRLAGPGQLGCLSLSFRQLLQDQVAHGAGTSGLLHQHRPDGCEPRKQKTVLGAEAPCGGP